MRVLLLALLLSAVATDAFLFPSKSTPSPSHFRTALFSDPPAKPPSYSPPPPPPDIPSSVVTRGGAGDPSKTSLQTIAYVFNSLGYAAVSAILLFMPDKTNMARLDAKLGGAAGFAMAAVLSNMLAGAAQRSTLRRDAYKKVNLGLLAFCAVGVAAVPGESAFTPLKVPATLLAGFMAMMRVIGGITSYFGWRAGVGNKNAVVELVEGALKTKESMDLEKKSKGYLYKWSAVAVGFGVLNSILEIGKSKLEFDVSLEVSTISRLLLVISMLLTLKDADERDQLSARTFFQMNFLIGSWCMLVGLGQGLTRVTGGFAFDFTKARMIICSVPFLLKGLKGRKDNLEKAEKKA